MAHLDVSGRWSITQSNGLTVFFDIVQQEAETTGSAFWRHSSTVYGEWMLDQVAATMSMEARGTVTDREFFFAISWDNGTRGIYEGVVDSDGRMTGRTRDAMDARGGEVSWLTDRIFTVLPADVAPAPRPPRRLGKRRPVPPQPNPVDVRDVGPIDDFLKDPPQPGFRPPGA